MSTRCTLDSDCAVGFACVGGTCQETTGLGDECLGDGNDCTNDTCTPVVSGQNSGPLDPCGVGNVPPYPCPKDPNCNKFCEDYFLATGSKLAGCDADSACGACDFCGSNGLCESKRADVRPCYCPGYIDPDTGEFVDTQEDRECFICNVENGDWEAAWELCQSTVRVTVVCDCPGETAQGVATSPRGRTRITSYQELYAQAIKDGQKKCEEQCKDPCEIAPEPEWTCNFQGPIAADKDPTINYPCPKGWNCWRQPQATTIDGAPADNPDGGYFWYTCAYPGWPNVTWDEYINTPSCGCPEIPPTCSNIKHNPANGPFVCGPGSTCTRTGTITAGGTTMEFWQICAPAEDVYIPGCTPDGYIPVYEAKAEAFTYTPCSCEEPIGERKTVPAYYELFVGSTPGKWPFEFVGVGEDDCFQKNLPNGLLACAYRTRLTCFPNPIGQGIICTPYNEPLYISTLCASDANYQYGRIIDVTDANGDTIITMSVNPPPIEFLNGRNYYREEAFVWSSRFDGDIENFYDLPPQPPEAVTYPRCSEYPTLVALLDSFTKRCAGDEAICNKVIAENPITFADYEYSGSTDPTPEGIGEPTEPEIDTAPPIPRVDPVVVVVDWNLPTDDERYPKVGATLATGKLDDGGGYIFGARFTPGETDVTADGQLTVSANSQGSTFKLGSITNLVSRDYSYQVGSQKSYADDPNSPYFAWSKSVLVQFRVYGQNPAEIVG